MKIFTVTCSFNISQTLIDCAFKDEADAKAYADALNNGKAKAIARCKELIAQRDSEAMLKFLDEKLSITFDVLPVNLKWALQLGIYEEERKKVESLKKTILVNKEEDYNGV